ALLQAAKSGDQASLIAIFGSDAKEILFSGDPVKDKNTLKDFATAYETMHRWGKIRAGGQMLYIGAENFPFPIPLQQNSSGKWYFNGGAGAGEILAGRIGRDELVPVAGLAAIANAEQQYFNHSGNKVKQYAQKFVSDEGKHNGLYWNASNGENESPIGPLVAYASSEGYAKKLSPFQGYYFRVLMGQGNHASGGAKNYVVNGQMTRGFAFLAYPAEYAN